MTLCSRSLRTTADNGSPCSTRTSTGGAGESDGTEKMWVITKAPNSPAEATTAKIFVRNSFTTAGLDLNNRNCLVPMSELIGAEIDLHPALDLPEKSGKGVLSGLRREIGLAGIVERA